MEKNNIITGVFDNKNQNTGNVDNINQESKENDNMKDMKNVENVQNVEANSSTPLESLKKDTQSNPNFNNILSKKISAENFVKAAERLIRTGLGTEQLKKDFAAFVGGHITTNYVPYEVKVDSCKNIVRSANHKALGEGENAVSVFVQDTPAQNMLYDLMIVNLYTDIDIRFKDHALDDYNTLERLDLINMIKAALPNCEMEKFDAVMSMVMDDVYENERSVNAFVDGVVTSIKQVGSEVWKAVIDGVKSSGITWSDILGMMG